MKTRLIVAATLVMLAVASASAVSGRVLLLRTPDGGIQPQATVDQSGVVHLIYYKEDPAAGDIFYVRSLSNQTNFSQPLKVNSRPGTATALGTIRGAQLAVGRQGRVHVAWDGMGKGAAPVSIQGKAAAPLLYTRLNDAGTAFEPERNVISFAAGLDGGSSVAADARGNVYVAWQAPQPGATNQEAGRAVFIARSQDQGKTFQQETPALSKPTGACPCCGMRAFADDTGAVYILFRAAMEGVNRDELLLVASGPGAEFRVAHADHWQVHTCPMSSATLTPAKGGALAAWETAGQVYCAMVNRQNSTVSTPICPPGQAARKHPVAVANAAGEMLLVWTEGTGWAKGGTVAWQLYSPEGTPTPEHGRAEGVPTWSLATAFARADGGFVIVY